MNDKDAARQFSKKLNNADKCEIVDIIRHYFEGNNDDEIKKYADVLRREHYERRVYFRGLVEISSYCINDCFYCGIRKGNKSARRYRLNTAEILNCCEDGHGLGFRTFVLQGGEDAYFTDDILCNIINEIKKRFPDSAVTLSLGERSRKSYKKLYDAGADRYLLRHETANYEHYKKLHPSTLSLKSRMDCLYSLKEIGFQTGAGFMVGSPFQTYESLADDLVFLRELRPHMVGLGPFVPHKDSIFAGHESGSTAHTIVMLALVRIILPKALLPATTALGTIDPQGREKALNAGANVVMPNLSPISHRKDYELYDNKVCTGEEAAECLNCISKKIISAGYEPDFSRGDFKE